MFVFVLLLPLYLVFNFETEMSLFLKLPCRHSQIPTLPVLIHILVEVKKKSKNKTKQKPKKQNSLKSAYSISSLFLVKKTMKT